MFVTGGFMVSFCESWQVVCYSVSHLGVRDLLLWTADRWFVTVSVTWGFVTCFCEQLTGGLLQCQSLGGSWPAFVNSWQVVCYNVSHLGVHDLLLWTVDRQFLEVSWPVFVNNFGSCALLTGVILKGKLTLQNFVSDVCARMFCFYICRVTGFVDWLDKRFTWEEVWNVQLLMAWVWLSWGDPVWLTGR